MKCNLITDCENRVGLATDCHLLERFLIEQGHQVATWDWQRQIEAADVNFYIEKFSPRFLSAVKRHVGIFNPEWFAPQWLEPIRFGLTQIWAKSTAAFDWFVSHGCGQVRYTSFLSRNPFDPSIERYRRVLHLAGRSAAKNTTAVLRAYWDAAGAGVTLPPLVVVSHSPIEPLPPGVIQYNYELTQSFLDRLLNECRFHLCPSEVEGWGHYIAEATACGGIVITLDRSPMNEHVLRPFGALLEPLRTHSVPGSIERYEADPGMLASILLQWMDVDDYALDRAGERARAWNRQRNAAFELCAKGLLQELAE